MSVVIREWLQPCCKLGEAELYIVVKVSRLCRNIFLFDNIDGFRSALKTTETDVYCCFDKLCGA